MDGKKINGIDNSLLETMTFLTVYVSCIMAIWTGVNRLKIIEWISECG